MPSKRTPKKPRERQSHGEFVTVAEAAAEAGMGRTAVYKRMKDGLLDYIQVGAIYLIHRADAQALRKLRTGPKPKEQS